MFRNTFKDILYKYIKKEAPIIVNEKYLEDISDPSKLPDIKILHREREIEELIKHLSPLFRGRIPSNIFIFGKPGLGKTLVTRYVLYNLEEEFNTIFNEYTLKSFYINFRVDNLVNTPYRLLAFILRKFNVEIPYTGMPLDYAYEEFIKVLEKNKGIYIIVLDEIDELIIKKKERIDIFRTLLSIQDELKNSKLVLISIANNLRFTEKLDEKIKVKFSNEIYFYPYTTEQLYDILKERAKLALRENSYDEIVLRRIAAIAAKDEGNARRAIQILREAAMLAEKEGRNKILLEDVEQATYLSEERRLLNIVSKLPFHLQLVLKSIIILIKNKGVTTTGEIYRKYKALCEILGVKPLTLRRISDLIGELEVMGLISSEIVSKGRYGRTREVKIEYDKNLVEKLDYILNDSLRLYNI